MTDQESHSHSLLSPENLCALVLAIGKLEGSALEKTPCHTSSLTGSNYIQEVLASKNPHRIRDVLRMPGFAFTSLCQWMINHDLLTDGSGTVGIEEQLAIFMRIVGQKSSNRDTQERFQHSGETISR